MQTFPLEEPPSPRKPTGAGVKAFIRIAVSTIFVFACYGAGKLAIKMASKGLPESELTIEPPARQRSLSLQGTRDEPLFMGSDREALRAFFTNNPTVEARIKASLESTGIRKIPESLEVQTMRSEADAIQVRVTDGAVAGAVYWVHHSQMKEDPAFDPIISPIPVVPGAPPSRSTIPTTDEPESTAPGTILN
ncbi:MAG: hypothetical protein P1U86_03885 [Verrucomicrobiales bacterium]|nr:hypothetical protein [Verrucomicrobiales bacterium]